MFFTSILQLCILILIPYETFRSCDALYTIQFYQWLMAVIGQVK